jgi:hypothetical protein
MIRFVILLSFTILLLFIQACAQTKPFVSSEGRFSIDLYTAPTEETNSAEAKLGGKKLWWKNGRATFMVSYGDAPNATKENAEAVVAASAEGYIGLIPKGAEILSKVKTNLDGYPGFQVKSQEKDGFTVIARYYVAEKRIYCVMVMWNAGSNDDYAVKTINSFKLISPAPVQ